MKKKVAFIIPSLKNGGAERVLSTISQNLNQNNEQIIFTWDSSNQDYLFNAKILEISTKNSKNILKNILVLYKRVKEVKKYKKQLGIETCISHLEGPNIVNILSKGNEKTIITVHNFQSQERKGIYGYIFRILIKLLYNRADQIVVVSKLIKNDLVHNFNIQESKIQVIYNPFDCKLIESLSKEPLEEEYKVIFNESTIINVGRLTEQKGQWNLIKSFYELKKINTEARLVILGQGELEFQLKELVQDLGLQESVYFLGFQKNPFKFIHHAKVFALTSLYEGFPMCIAESMICGTPVITVDCLSGPREMLDSQTQNLFRRATGTEELLYGILLPVFGSDKTIYNRLINDQEKLFAKALQSLISDSDKNYNLAKKAKLHAYQFDVDKIISQWEQII